MKKGGSPKWIEEDAMPIMKPIKKGMEGKMEHDMNHHGPMPECMLLAHAYVPWQNYECAFSPCEALMKGTLFPELWGVYPIPE